MKKAIVLASFCALLLLVTAGPVVAETVQVELQNVAVSTYTGPDGLIVNSTPTFTHNNIFNVSTGSPVPPTQSLFSLWTPESTVNYDDTIARTIAVTVALALPANLLPQGTTGDTVGVALLNGLFQYGQVTWNGPIKFALADGSELNITLSDATFDFGLFGLDGGRCKGANIAGAFNLIGPSVATPEPSVMGLLGFGVVALGTFRRRIFS